MAAVDVKKVLRLKHQLKESSEGHTLLKILKKLEVLDISLEILAETGIGKVVNSFRKHNEAGKIAKILVNRWKSVVPKDSISERKSDDSKSRNEMLNREEKSKRENIQNLDSRKKSKIEKSNVEKKSFLNDYDYDDDKCSKHQINNGGKKSMKDWSSGREKGNSEKAKVEKSESKEPKKSKLENETRDGGRRERMSKAKPVTPEIEDGDENPSMSFEACLSYDLKPLKRKKSIDAAKNPKRVKTQSVSLGSVKLSRNEHKTVNEELTPRVPEPSVMELLNIPLPVSFPECEDLSQYQYCSEKKEDVKQMGECEEAPVFIGQRLKNKMQVYSGTKMTFLPSMMTLYQQCIRALQNNIDSLYEIGGVPFEILEPVLERCTAEQLLRIEEYNPVYIGLTDHLWEKHCQREFRNARLEEYESWKEMYLRMFEERERKLKLLTKSIVSAHSGKPKGRQVKMAFIHSAAKPPRNIRIQQEIHGTAGPVSAPPHTDRTSSVKPSENRPRSSFSETLKPSSQQRESSSQSQDPRKIKRVAPMMAKSLKAFKKQINRR
ncbi:hypothetical protein DNTS_033573 [Danionella cerebrum]|uniref:TFIIS N-terminal domain-containing protein n=1 Tax=Danionella cerebrum TaxID=2873325 RepID=A0A553R457_9TELE|nr:hypothetical protein DNTS_033573 [Danionella translucida]